MDTTRAKQQGSRGLMLEINRIYVSGIMIRIAIYIAVLTSSWLFWPSTIRVYAAEVSALLAMPAREAAQVLTKERKATAGDWVLACDGADQPSYENCTISVESRVSQSEWIIVIFAPDAPSNWTLRVLRPLGKGIGEGIAITADDKQVAMLALASCVELVGCLAERKLGPNLLDLISKSRHFGASYRVGMREVAAFRFDLAGLKQSKELLGSLLPLPSRAEVASSLPETCSLVPDPSGGASSNCASRTVAVVSPHPNNAPSKILALPNRYVEGQGYQTLTRSTFPDCAERCREQRSCQMMEFHKLDRSCNLYDHTNVAGLAPMADVGVKFGTSTEVIVQPDQRLWEHDGSTVILQRFEGQRLRFTYEHPRPILQWLGVKPGAILFDGFSRSGRYIGTTRVFGQACGEFPYVVEGPDIADQKVVTLKGSAPVLNAACQVTGARDEVLVLRLSNPVARPDQVKQSDVDGLRKLSRFLSFRLITCNQRVSKIVCRAEVISAAEQVYGRQWIDLSSSGITFEFDNGSTKKADVINASSEYYSGFLGERNDVLTFSVELGSNSTVDRVSLSLNGRLGQRRAATTQESWSLSFPDWPVLKQ